MMQTWSGWKRFSDLTAIDAPDGPGVYEVRHTLTGRVVAFGHSADVSRSVAELKSGEISPWARLIGRQRLDVRPSDLEYRTCSAESRADAKTAAQRLLGLRQSAWRRRMDFGRASHT